ncbi:MAG: DUF4160 domain-containing protein [Saprospiraceae bacterium]|nr:DUF4160 domain-containing protein [Saprospiraceae bacterium]
MAYLGYQNGCQLFCENWVFRFFFYSNEGNEPPHVHVEKEKGRGKYWIEPAQKEYMYNFSKQDEKKVDDIVEEEQENFKKKWYEFFG